jgi:hypothetical protein
MPFFHIYLFCSKEKILEVEVHAHVQRPVSVVKMATVLEVYITEKQRSTVCFLSERDLIRRILKKKCFLFTVESVCCLGGKGLANDEEVETEVPEWLRQQSKDFYAAVKQRSKCINVGGGYVEKYFFFPSLGYHIFYVLYPFITYLLTPSCILYLD